MSICFLLFYFLSHIGVMGVLGLHVCMVIFSSTLDAVDTGPGCMGLHLLGIIEHADGQTALPDHFVKGGDIIHIGWIVHMVMS